MGNVSTHAFSPMREGRSYQVPPAPNISFNQQTKLILFHACTFMFFFYLLYRIDPKSCHVNKIPNKFTIQHKIHTVHKSRQIQQANLTHKYVRRYLTDGINYTFVWLYDNHIFVYE